MKHFISKNSAFKPFLLFKTGEPEAIPAFESEAAKKTFEKGFHVEMKVKPGLSREEFITIIENQFKPVYGPDKYEQDLAAHVRQYIPKKTPQNVVNKLVKDSRVLYESFYGLNVTKMYQAKEDWDEVFEKKMDNIRDKTSDELDKVHQAVENLRALRLAKENIQEVKLEIDDTQKQFTGYLKALNKQYLNIEWVKDHDHLTSKEHDRYKRLSGHHLWKDGFSDGMEDYVKYQVAFIFENSPDKDTLKKNLETFRDHVAKLYKETANEDGLIGLKELEKMQKAANRDNDLMRMLHEGKSDEEIVKKMENLNFFDRDVFQSKVENVTDALIEAAEKNGSHAVLIQFIETKSGKKNLDFDDATSLFRKMTTNRANAGVKEAVQFISDYNETVNGGLREILSLEEYNFKNVTKKEVYDARELLLRSTKIPERNLDDKNVVDFMKGGLEERVKILKNEDKKEALIRSVANIKKYYLATYQKRNREGAAHLLAMLTLAKEAEWIIGNLSKADAFKDKGLADALASQEAQENPPPIDTKPRDIRTLYPTRYVSELGRGGFNFRDLALSAGKILAVTTIVTNAMNARKSGFFKGEFVEKLVSNPYTWLAGGALWGLSKEQKRPGYLETMATGGEAANEQRRHFDGLDWMKKKKISASRIRAFAGNGNEFAVMREIMKDPKGNSRKIKKLVEKAQKENPKKPKLTKAMLEEAFESRVAGRLDVNGDAEARFWFYSKFLTNEKTNVDMLQQNCLEWKPVS